MTSVLGIIVAAVVIVFAVAIHEFGHMIAALWCGVGVVEYSIGMGPVLFHKRIKDTVVSVRLIPIGGYCAMVGEQSMEAHDKGAAAEEIRHMDETEEERKKRLRFKRKPMGYKTDWSESQKLSSAPWYKRILIYMAGPLMNILTAFIACVILVLGFNAARYTVVSEIIPDHPSAETQIAPGDIIVGINNRDFLTYDAYEEYDVTHKAEMTESYEMRVKRGDEVISIPARKGEDGLFGIRIKAEFDKSFEKASVLDYSWDLMKYQVNMVGDSFKMLGSGQAKMKDLSGVVGMTAVITDTVDEAVMETTNPDNTTETGPVKAVLTVMFFMMALLGVNLGIMNMVPLPALDGGRILLCIFEGIFRKPLPERAELAINTIGMSLLMGLLCYTFVNDIMRIVTGTSF